MKKPLRVLAVEDSDNDALLLRLELQRGGFEPTLKRVDTVGDMTSALETEPWDVVISDHTMPGFGSLDALKILKGKQPDIPFIVVSGTIGEDAAVSAMKAGASDYVTKGKLARLIPSIERELREAETRRAQRRIEEELKQTQAVLAYLAAIVESSDDAIIGKALDGTILTWNPAAARMYGYSAEEVKGKSISMLIPEARPEELPPMYDKIRQGERVKRCETVRVRKDGTIFDVSLRISPIKDEKGRLIGVSSIERDITVRKREENERLKLIQELREALANIKTLKGLLPICASCKKIRDDGGYWQKVELYISSHTDAEFTHGICPDCMQRLYPEYVIPNKPRE